ncbi:MAG: hypothetical protein AABY53_09230 [Bdellovibrionota bacterium]
MDRVLLIIDDIQYSRHIEMTLRKVGFDVESTNNEFNVLDSVLIFNPNYIICRGSSSRLSPLNVGRKLKESNAKYTGKVIFVFPEGSKISADDLIQLKVDSLLFEPISTLKLAMHLFSFSKNDFEFIRDKLLKFAITDNQFRNYEQQILKKVGLTIDSEIQIVSGMEYKPPPPMMVNSSEPDSAAEGFLFSEPENMPQEVTDDVTQQIKQELEVAKQELPLRIDTYNHIAKNVDQELNSGLQKRQTKKAANQMRKDLINEQKTDIKSEQAVNDEKVRFAHALFKRKS